MEREPGAPGAFTLASAQNGSTQSLTYEFPEGPSAERERREYGAMAAGRSALSADGRKVVFVTTATSNLAGPGTPPLQVAVRDLDTDETKLASVRLDPATGRPLIDPETGRPEPVPRVAEGASAYGAVYTTGTPPPFTTPQPYQLTPEVPASISADGSTVAWLAQNLVEQAPTLSAEAISARYNEPLWRRIGDGEDAPTRRVTGGSDPLDPECESHPEPRPAAQPVGVGSLPGAVRSGTGHVEREGVRRHHAAVERRRLHGGVRGNRRTRRARRRIRARRQRTRERPVRGRHARRPHADGRAASPHASSGAAPKKTLRRTARSSISASRRTDRRWPWRPSGPSSFSARLRS